MSSSAWMPATRRAWAGPAGAQEYGQAPLVVIDHHVTNMQFGTLNWVDTRRPPPPQVLVDLADALGAADSA